MIPAMSSTAPPVITASVCPNCETLVGVEGPGFQICAHCGQGFQVLDQLGSRKDETVEAEPLPPDAPPSDKSRRDKLVDQAVATLAQMIPMLLDRYLPGQDSHVAPVAGMIDCIDCQALLSDLRGSLAGIEQHLEAVHAWWPAELEAVLLDTHKQISRVARGLRTTRHIALVQGDQDPYALVRQSEPDLTGTPQNSPERLAAVLRAHGSAPMLDPETGDLEPDDAASLHLAPDLGPGNFLDGHGDAAPDSVGDLASVGPRVPLP